MARRISFSDGHLGLPQIAEHHVDLESSLRLYFSNLSPAFGSRFVGYSYVEVLEELGGRINDTNSRSE